VEGLNLTEDSSDQITKNTKQKCVSPTGQAVSKTQAKARAVVCAPGGKKYVCPPLLPLLYERETWSLTSSEKHRLRENAELKRIFRSKRNKAIGDWKELHSEEPNYLYFSPNIISPIKSRAMR
jgi:hypothetical protein